MLGVTGLWNYDLRRTFATSMSNELGYDDSTIRAILNHHDTSALSHYRHKSFDSLTEADSSLCGLALEVETGPQGGRPGPGADPETAGRVSAGSSTPDAASACPTIDSCTAARGGDSRPRIHEACARTH